MGHNPKNKITKELQATLEENPVINCKPTKNADGTENPAISAYDKVYFDANGNHYFRVFNAAKGYTGGKKSVWDATKADYGRCKHSHFKAIPGLTNEKDKPIKESVSFGIPETLIVDTMTREEVLSFEVAGIIKPTSLLDGFNQASQADKDALIAALKASLTPTPTVAEPAKK